jgi:phospholipase C
VVIYLENHSFDNLYGEFAGAEGITNAMTFAAAHKQVDSTGTPYTTLPPDPETAPMMSILPNNLPNAPFNLDQYVPLNWTTDADGGPSPATTPDVTHRYYHEIAQINGGKMDNFVWLNSSLGMAMGYYHTANLKLATEAKNFTLCDHFFHAAFGGSFLNHQWLIAAATPKWEGTADGGPVAPPASMVSIPDLMFKTGIADAILTPAPDYNAINTCFSVNKPIPSFANMTQLLPNFTNPTIGDRLTAASITWAWYSGGWDNALAGTPAPTFQFHHQPFYYYKNFADGTAAKTMYLLDETKFIAAATAGTLPAVSFVKPLGVANEHPAYTDIATGEQHTLDLINAVRNGPNWGHSVIIVTYDEHGGYWDHVPPPTGDKWGPGSRVPTIIISPYAKKGYIDSTSYDTTAILALIEKRFNITPLGTRDAASADISAHALDFTLAP